MKVRQPAINVLPHRDSSNLENRRAYREWIIKTPGLGEFISGMILYDETIRQHDADGYLSSQIIADEGIIPGIKVDTGAKDLAGSSGRKSHRRAGRPARPPPGI
jgi:fructose-bisphosphate aldolase class 1